MELNLIYIVISVLGLLTLVAIISFIVVYNRRNGDVCPAKKCGGKGSVFTEDGVCKCQCPTGWSGDDCELVEKGFYLKEGVPVKSTKCVREHGEYEIAPSTDTRNTICGTCPDGFYADDEGGCSRCTDCDAPDGGKYFVEKCLNNSDAVCGDYKCQGESQYYEPTQKRCIDHKNCEGKRYLEKGTNSYDARCVDSCPKDKAFVVDGVCTECTQCDPHTERVVGECTTSKDRVCEKCPPNHYVEDNKCLPTPCRPGFYLTDDKKCVLCSSCNGDFVTTERCGIRSNTKCAKRCPWEGDYALVGSDDVGWTCEKCEECDELLISECEVWNPENGRVATKPAVCRSYGQVGSQELCPKCNLGEIAPEYGEDKRWRRCESDKECSSNADCDTSSPYMGICDENGRCMLRDEYYCDGSERCKDVSSACSTLPSPYLPVKITEEDGSESEITVKMDDSLYPSDATVASGKIRIGDYETKGEYDWGDSCIISEEDANAGTYKCVLNISRMKDFADMVCDTASPEYDEAVCEKLKSGEPLECGTETSCMYYS